MTNSRKRIFLTMAFLMVIFLMGASETSQDYDRTGKSGSESLFVNKHYKPSSHFVWGAEIGTSIDVTGYDSSTFNVDALLGYKNTVFNLIGVGIGIHRAMGSGDNYVPVYAVLRTSFTKQPKPVFMSLKLGYSFNTIGDANTFGDINASLGCGINLASSSKFRSYLIIAYEFRHFNEKHRDAVSIEDPNISMASLTLGFNF